MNEVHYLVRYINVIVVFIAAETRTEEFKKINPVQTIPAIVHGDFKMFERYNHDNLECRMP